MNDKCTFVQHKSEHKKRNDKCMYSNGSTSDNTKMNKKCTFVKHKSKHTILNEKLNVL